MALKPTRGMKPLQAQQAQLDLPDNPADSEETATRFAGVASAIEKTGRNVKEQVIEFVKPPSVASEAVAIKGCDYIYAPAGQAGEYAPLATNPYRGCGNGCVYCYVPKVISMPRPEFDKGAVPRPNFLQNLIKDAKKYQAVGSKEQVMLSFTTDPYHPGDTYLTRQTLTVLRDAGLGFCTLTKGGTRALRDLDLFRPDRDAFASTLTSVNDDFSKKWERGAALPGDRMKALKTFHDAGIFTWVSLEPTLNIKASLRILELTHEYVDLFKIGRVNYLPMTETTDWEDYTHQVIELCAKLGIKHYIKKDLQRFLPKGYPNPLRVPQFHGDSGKPEVE
jgi:hypothetical protein